tara:strand:- start:5847 stop:8267 length:2421 start_codon:yes stop_codon:yes gene_type:complete
VTAQNSIKNSPFQGLLIVDIGGTVATGYATKLFADYGARVVNIEPQQGFFTRRLKPLLQNGNSAIHAYLHANKESVCCDDLQASHPAIVAADLVLLDLSTLPSSVSVDDFDTNVCAISWYGLNGPYADFQGSDASIYALIGLMQGVGESQGPPIIPTGYQPQIVGGLSAFNGAAGYLLGQHFKDDNKSTAFCLDASILEANMCLTEIGAAMSFNQQPLPQRMGINRFAPTYPLGIWPCKDGWLGVTVLNPAQWLAFCELLGLDDLAAEPKYQNSMARLDDVDILEPRFLQALSQYSAEELFYRGQGMRIPLARVPTMEELLSVDQYVQRRAFSEYSCDGETFQAPSCPFRLLETPPRFGGDAAKLGADNRSWKTQSLSTKNAPDVTHCDAKGEEDSNIPQAPLEGLTIIDLSMGWAGPLATRNLADMGATVIKVESCTRFDWFRSWEASQEWIDNNGAEKEVRFIGLNRNKLDVTLDFESKEGRDLLLRLIENADAVIENYSGGVLPKLKLDYPVLKAVNPQLVMVSMPAFGATGPWAKFRAYGSTVEQSAGLPHLQGSEQQPPTMLHVAFGDAIAGLYGSAALLTALFHKKKTGRGQFVDLSQVECLLPHAVHGVVHQSVYNQPPKRQGNYHPDYFIHAVFACAGEEQWLLLQVKTREQWVLASDLIPILKAFDNLTADERRAQFANIQASLVDWMATQQATWLMHQLQSTGITAVALNRASDLMDDPHLLARGYMQFIERDFMGQQPHPISPWRVGQDPITIKTSAPTLGQHNRRVLGGMLGLSDAQLDALDGQGVIGSKPRLA